MHDFWRWGMAPLATSILATWLAGCLARPDDSDLPRAAELTIPRASTLSAFFLLTGADLRSPGWPAQWEPYSVFVCTPSLDAAQVAQARADRPDARFLAYTSVADIHIRMFPENPYWAALEAAFDSSLAARDMIHDRMFRMGPRQIPYYVMGEHSADVLVEFHRDVTMAAGFDGLYLDNCTGDIPDYRIVRMFEQTQQVDVDGDWEADDVGTIFHIYRTWRPYYTARLRWELGEDVVLVGNAGGPLADRMLNGITLEGVGDRIEAPAARVHFAQQRLVGRPPFLAVAWVTTTASDAPSRKLLPDVQGLHYGFVRE